MICGPRSQGPVEPAFGLGDRDVVDAGLAAAHQAVLHRTPSSRCHTSDTSCRRRRAIRTGSARRCGFVEAPEFLDQPVLELLRPFARQERDDRGAAVRRIGAIAPTAVFRIGERDLHRSRVFQASSAMRAFCAAVSRVNGGSGGRDIDLLLRTCLLPAGLTCTHRYNP